MSQVRIEVSCAGCGEVFHVLASQQGEVEACPRCAGWVDVPDLRPLHRESQEVIDYDRKIAEYDRQQEESRRQTEECTRQQTESAKQLVQGQKNLDDQERQNNRWNEILNQIEQLSAKWNSLTDRAQHIIDKLDR